MKTINLRQVFCITFFTFLFFATCKKRPPGPFLKSLSPEQGSVGTRITIEGENLFYFEKAYVNDAEVTEEPAVTSNGERMELIIPDNVALGMAEVYLLYEDGRSNSLSFEVIDGTSGNGKPVISMLLPATVLPGCELQITGENLSGVTEVIFPVGLQAEILSQSATQLIVQVPLRASSGMLFLYTSTDTISRNIMVSQGVVPLIDRILPAGNDQGGPVLVYGRSLDMVSQIFFGEVEQPVFEQTFNTLKFHVPVSDNIKGKTVSLQLKTNQGCFSPAFAYEVGNGVSAQSPTGNSVNIIIPNVPGGVTLPGIANNWKVIKKFWTDDPELDFLNLGITLPSGMDTIFLTDYGDTLAVYANNGTFLQVKFDGQFYFGAFDNNYPDFNPDDDIISPLRFVLTPLDFGDQIELIKPYVIDINNSKIEGNKFTIKGRYFTDYAANDIEVRIFTDNYYDEIDLLFNNSVDFLDKTTLEFQLLDTLPLGSYYLVLEDQYELDVRFTNAFPFEIN